MTPTPHARRAGGARSLRSLAVGAALLLQALAIQAQTLKVLSAGALKEVVLGLVPEFEARTALKVEVQSDTAGALVKRVESGQAFDVAVVTRGGLDRLAALGKVDPATGSDLADVGIGVGVKEGAPQPPLATVEAFKAMLLGASRIAYIDPASGGSSGIYLEQLFRQLGLAEAVKAKAVLVPGGLAGERVVRGEADLVLQQVSELLSVKGLVLAGMLPDPIQHHTTYAAGVSSQSGSPVAARAFLALLAGKTAAELIRAQHMRPAH